MKPLALSSIITGICCIFWSQVSIAQSANAEKSVEERIGALEKVINPPNPLAHDIGLRRELEKSITQQEHINEHIDKINGNIEELEGTIKNQQSSIASGQFNKTLDKKLTEIRKEFLSLLDLTKKQNTENLNAFVASSDKALASATSSADSTTHTLNAFVQFVQIVLGLLTLLGTFIGFLVYKSFNTLKEARKISERIKNTIGDELNQLQLLKKEIKLLHKFVDLKDSYRMYRTLHKKREIEHLKCYLHQKVRDLITGYRDLEHLWKNEDINGNKKEFLNELYDNLSYCYAVKGVLEYNEGDKLESSKWFELAYHNNVNSFTDRIHNFGCASAFRYAKTHEQSHLDKVVDCYIELAQFSGERERFVEDDDIELKLKAEIDRELRSRKQESLIVPDPKQKD